MEEAAAVLALLPVAELQHQQASWLTVSAMLPQQRAVWSGLWLKPDLLEHQTAVPKQALLSAQPLEPLHGIYELSTGWPHSCHRPNIMPKTCLTIVQVSSLQA